MMKEPKNFAFWYSVIKDPEQCARFMVKGNERQKRDLRRAFRYMEFRKEQGQKDLFEK
jgi:hypothetical protein